MDQFVEALSAAMDRARMNQSELGRAAGAAPAMISAWLAGKTANPDPQKVFAVERALGLPPGFLSKHLGYKPISADETVTATDVPSAVEADPWLSRHQKDLFHDLYERSRRRSADAANDPRTSESEPSTSSSR